jgi:N-acetylglucosamine-6-phosphate deacetylase
VSLVIGGGRVVTPQGTIEADIHVADGRIAGIGTSLRGGEALDASGCTIVPGFIDLQVNGGFGHDFTSQPRSIWDVGARLPEHGVTSFMPTIVSAERRRIDEAISVVAAGPPAGYHGAGVLGLHIEGPFLAADRRGAHRQDHLAAPDLDTVADWRPPGVRMVTIAPELPGAEGVVRELAGRGVVVAAGHSSAGWETLEQAKGWGVTHGTHLFNAMSGVSHRHPGLAGFLLADPDLTCGIIVDGWHLHPGAVRLAWRAKGPGEIALVTDSMAGLGMADGRYSLGGVTVDVTSGVARTTEGRLAGGAASFDTALRLLIEATGCRLEEAALAAATTAATIIGDHERGRLLEGAIADLTVLDGDLAVAATVVGGSVAHERGHEGRDHGDA